MKPKWEVTTDQGSWEAEIDRFVTLKRGSDQITFHSYKDRGVHTASIFTYDNRFELDLPFEEFRAIFDTNTNEQRPGVAFNFIPRLPGELIVKTWSETKCGPKVENRLVWQVPTKVLKKFRKEIKELLK